jgi:anti-sigma regulatory factor (Ser/Thr protein kinase)
MSSPNTDSSEPGKDPAGPTAASTSSAPGADSGTSASRGQAFASAVRRSTPVVKSASIGFTSWLVSISWGKFFLLAILLQILAAVTFSFFISSGGGGGKWKDHGEIKVDVHVVPLPDSSIAIQSADDLEEEAHDLAAKAKERAAQAQERAKHAVDRAHRTTNSKMHKDDDVLLQIDGDGTEKNPSVRIDSKGIRILADSEHGKQNVIIDDTGVHIEKIDKKASPGDAKAGQGEHEGSVAPAPPAPPAPPVPPMPVMPDLDSDSTVRVKPEPPGSPENVAMAVEAARDQIETILQDQVDDKLEAFHEDDRAEREDWLVLLTAMGIIAMSILKVALGSKTKAETQARKASAVAAEEGLKRQLAEAQIKMMQAQVEPHFLFNTLASVDYLIETDPSRASRMQKNLIQYLRAALPQMREGSSTLGREIVQCRSYLEILKVRMDERLQFSIHVPQGLLSASFPPMMLLTLVENSIKHGLEPKAEGGNVTVSAQVADGSLRVAVADSGLGFGVAQRGGTGVGLANVRERLRALYGADANLVIDANSEGGTIATIIVPYRIEGESSAASAAAAAAGAPAV